MAEIITQRLVPSNGFPQQDRHKHINIRNYTNFENTSSIHEE